MRRSRRNWCEFLRGAELIIHNAAFDVAFLDAEFARLPGEPVTVASICTVVDSLALARQMHPGQRNGLDALCKRYNVDNSGRQLHGALLDAQLLGEVYLAMTGGQVALRLGESGAAQSREERATARAAGAAERALACRHAPRRRRSRHTRPSWNSSTRPARAAACGRKLRPATDV